MHVNSGKGGDKNINGVQYSFWDSWDIHRSDEETRRRSQDYLKTDVEE